MEDLRTIERIRLLHPIVVDEVMGLYRSKVVPALSSSVFCRFAYTLRTFEEQNELYAQGRTKLFDANGRRLGVITNAKAGQSFHNYGLAFDIVLIDRQHAIWDSVKDFDGDGVSDWMEVINIFKEAGWKWGGDFRSFKDTPHLEKTFGYTHQQLLSLYNAKNFLPGTNYVTI